LESKVNKSASSPPHQGKGRVRRRPSLVKLTLFSLLPVVILLVAAEIYLTVIGFRFVPDQRKTVVMAEATAVWDGFTTEDPDLLYRFAPRAGEDIALNELGLLPLHAIGINSLGYRGAEFPAHKQDKGTVRILCYGDSVTFGVSLMEGETIPARLQQLLTAAGKNVEVLNMALPSYTSTQNVWDWEKYGKDYEPDIVVLHWSCWNDFHGGSNQMSDRDVRDERRRHDALKGLVTKARLGQFLLSVAETRAGKIRRREYERARSEQSAAHMDHPADIRRVTLEELRGNRDRFLHEIVESGIDVVVVVPAEPSKTRHEWGTIYGAYHDILRAVPVNEHTRMIDLQPAALEAGDDKLFYDFCHYNQKGAMTVAQLWAPVMMELIEHRRVSH